MCQALLKTGDNKKPFSRQAKYILKNQEAITVLHSLISTAIRLIIKRDW